MTVLKLLRIVILMSVLFVLLVGSWMTEKRLASWERPVWVTVYPIAADDAQDTRDFVESLNERSFDEINQFFERASLPYGIHLTPVFRFQIAPPAQNLPPELPDLYSPAAVAWWSLKMRWWAWRQERNDGLIAPDIQMFVLFRAVENAREVEISVGMRKGLYGLVNAFASAQLQSRNQVVIAHELMHVLGATDKYQPGTGQPVFPDGYAEPNRSPVHPQRKAEIMGGRIPVSGFESVMPPSLEYCAVGAKTAEEIGFYQRLLEH